MFGRLYLVLRFFDLCPEMHIVRVPVILQDIYLQFPYYFRPRA